MNIVQLKEMNPGLVIEAVTGQSFRKYGHVLEGYDFNEIVDYILEETIIPGEGNLYVASDEKMENMAIKAKLQQQIYGELPIQIGYCNGMNSTLNGLEFHKGSEVNVAVTDLVLLLGCVQDIVDGRYHSDQVQAFFLPKGIVVEIYATTLHFAPCKTEQSGFKCVVVLPQGTNLPLTNTQEGDMLFAKNKWLLVHPERKALVEKGAYIGIDGENIELVYSV